MALCFSLSGFLAFIFSLSFGLFVFLKHKDKRIGKSWFLFNLSIALWGLGTWLIPFISDEKTAVVAWKVTYAFSANWISVLFYHFVCVFCGLDRRKFLISQYAVAVFFFLISPTSLIYSGAIWVFNSFYYSKAGALYVINSLWWLALVVYVHVELFQSYRKAITFKKLQFKYFLIASIVGFGGGALDFIPPLGINLYPWGNFTIFLYPTIMAYAIVQYRLMDINLAFRYTASYALAGSGVLASIGLALWLTDYSVIGMQWILGGLAFCFLVSKFQPAVLNWVDFLPPFRRYQGRLERAMALQDLICESRTLEECYQKIIQALDKHFDPKTISVLYKEKNASEYLTRAHKGLNPSDWMMTCLPENLSAMVAYFKADKNIALREISSESKSVPKHQRKLFENEMKYVGAEVSVPIFINDKLVFIVNMGPKKNQRIYNDLDLQDIGMLAQTMKMTLKSLLTEMRQKHFTEGLAHDLNSAFTKGRVMEHLKSLSQERLGTLNAEQKQLLKHIESALEFPARYMRELVDESAGLDGIHCKLEKGSLRTLIEEVQQHYEPEMRRLGISFEVKLPQEGLQANADWMVVKHRAFFNVLENALRHTQKNGKITLDFKVQGKYIVFCVHNTGSHIPQGEIDKIFEPGFQGEASASGVAGLGLSIVKEVMRAHQGNAWAQSDPDSGTSFYLGFPFIAK